MGRRVDVPLSRGLRTSEYLLPTALAAGTGGAYRTAAIGKWHVADAHNGWLEHPRDSGIDYYEAVLPMLPAGGLVVADNTLWSGRVLAPQDSSDHGIVRFNAHVAADDRVEHVLLSVRDGVMLARKR